MAEVSGVKDAEGEAISRVGVKRAFLLHHNHVEILVMMDDKMKV